MPLEFANPHIPLLKKAKSSWTYPIYIPSWNRAGIAPLLNMLNDAPRGIQNKVRIIVRPEQKEDYRKHYPWARLVLVKRPGLGEARMAGIRNAERRGLKRIVMLDDDIKHISLLERIERENKGPHTRRFSSRVSGVPEPMLFLRSLAVACKMADSAFYEFPDCSYGAARNALFSGEQQTKVGATSNRGSFPSCVFFFDVERFKTRRLPKDFHMHGEDLAICLDTLNQGQYWFTLPGVAYDQDGHIESMIPLDPTTAEGRQVDIDNAFKHYPDIAPYLKASYKNKLGGVMRIGFKWGSWYKDTGTEAIDVPIDELIG